MNILMKTLPNEVQIIIGGYIGSCQPKKLCDDIKSFCKTREEAVNLYMNTWKHRPSEVYDWLVNDTIRFLNRDVPTMYGYQDYYKNIMKRHFNLKNKDEQDINDVLGQIDEYSGEEDNNLFKISLGLLNPQERTELMHFFNTYQLSNTE